MGEALDDYYRQIGQFGGNPKPEKRKKADGREKRIKAHTEDEIKEYVRTRERGVCRCCRKRHAQSVHELRFRSLGGKVSKKNSVYVCGLLVGVEPSCHAYLQANRISYGGDAEGELVFTPEDQIVADWLGIKLGEQIVSAPMRETEIAE